MKQTDLGLNLSTKRTRKREFLTEMEGVVPWAALVELIAPYAPEGKKGRPPFALQTMLRIHFMQQWFTLSDPAMEEALHDMPLFREFAQLSWDSRLPDESTILRFRHLLEGHKLAEQILATINELLHDKGLMLKAGTVDATLIAREATFASQSDRIFDVRAILILDANYGSSGIGSSHHLSMEAMKVALGIDVQHVPFKGSSQSVPALIGGQVDVAFSALPSLVGFVKADKVKLLATNGAKRSPYEPDVPAIAELVPGFDFAVVVGVLAAKGTPQAAIDRISSEIEGVAKIPDMIQVLANAGVESVGSKPAEYGRAILDENQRLVNAIAAAGIN